MQAEMMHCPGRHDDARILPSWPRNKRSNKSRREWIRSTRLSSVVRDATCERSTEMKPIERVAAIRKKSRVLLLKEGGRDTQRSLTSCLRRVFGRRLRCCLQFSSSLGR